MKPSFALNLSQDGIGLLRRDRDGEDWTPVGEVPLDTPDLSGALGELRNLAAETAPETGLSCKIVLPRSQILYTAVTVPGPHDEGLEDRIADALGRIDGLPEGQIAFDWSGEGETLQVAIVTWETLSEAETFAEDQGFAPVSFVTVPEPGEFTGEPWFGPTPHAAKHLPTGAQVERDPEPVPAAALAALRGEQSFIPAAPQPLFPEEDAEENSPRLHEFDEVPADFAGFVPAADDAHSETDAPEAPLPSEAEAGQADMPVAKDMSSPALPEEAEPIVPETEEPPFAVPADMSGTDEAESDEAGTGTFGEAPQSDAETLVPPPAQAPETRDAGADAGIFCAVSETPSENAETEEPEASDPDLSLSAEQDTPSETGPETEAPADADIFSATGAGTEEPSPDGSALPDKEEDTSPLPQGMPADDTAEPADRPEATAEETVPEETHEDVLLLSAEVAVEEELFFPDMVESASPEPPEDRQVIPAETTDPAESFPEPEEAEENSASPEAENEPLFSGTGKEADVPSAEEEPASFPNGDASEKATETAETSAEETEPDAIFGPAEETGEAAGEAPSAPPLPEAVSEDTAEPFPKPEPPSEDETFAPEEAGPAGLSERLETAEDTEPFAPEEASLPATGSTDIATLPARDEAGSPAETTFFRAETAPSSTEADALSAGAAASALSAGSAGAATHDIPERPSHPLGGAERPSSPDEPAHLPLFSHRGKEEKSQISHAEPPLTTPAQKTAAGAAPALGGARRVEPDEEPAAEAEELPPHLTIFGGRRRREMGGKPHYLGAALSGALIVFLGMVGLWTAFLDQSGPTESTAPEQTPQVQANAGSEDLSSPGISPAPSGTASPLPGTEEGDETAATDQDALTLPPDADEESDEEAEGLQPETPPTASTGNTEETTTPEEEATAPEAVTPVPEPAEEQSEAAAPVSAPADQDAANAQHADLPPQVEASVAPAPAAQAPVSTPAVVPTRQGTALATGVTLYAGRPPHSLPARPKAVLRAADRAAQPPAPVVPPAAEPAKPVSEVQPPAAAPAPAGKRPEARPHTVLRTASNAAAPAPAPVPGPVAKPVPPKSPGKKAEGTTGKTTSNPTPARPQPRPENDSGIVVPPPTNGVSISIVAEQEARREAALYAKKQREAARARAAAEAQVAVSQRPASRPGQYENSVQRALAAAIAEESIPSSSATANATTPVAPPPVAAPVRSAPSPAPAPTVISSPKSEALASATREELDEPEPTSAAPKIPTTASVAKQATESDAIKLRKMNLIGIYGTANDRRALVRMPNGRFTKVGVGDNLDGGSVIAIGDGKLTYRKGLRSYTLELVSGG